MPDPTSDLEQAVLQTLRTVMDPDLHRDIVDLGFVKNLQIEGGNVRFDVELTTPACPVKDQLKEECHQKVAALQSSSRSNRLLLYSSREAGWPVCPIC